jgi:hypothetical protein
MKKFLTIIVLGLLMSGCQTTAVKKFEKGHFTAGISKLNLYYLMGTALADDPFGANCYRDFYPEKKLEVLSSFNKTIYFIFKDVSEPSMCNQSGLKPKNLGDGSLVKATPNLYDVEVYVGSNKPKKSKIKGVETLGITSEIDKLNGLYKRGTLTKKEFEKAKKKLLNK